MKVAGKATIATIEQLLKSLDGSSPDEPLKVPLRLRHLAGGGEASLVQFILTWAQATTGHLLETYMASADAEQVDDFVRRLPGLVASLCAKEIIGTSSEINLTAVVKQAAITRLEALQSRQVATAFRGSSAEIICADDISRGHPYLLYHENERGTGALRPRTEFHKLADWLLNKLTPIDFKRHLDSGASNAIGSMLYETFKNTEEHAIRKTNGDYIAPSVRAVKTNRFSISPMNLEAIVADFQPLADYCKSLSAPKFGTNTNFIELSVLDSGPGFAPTWTGKSLIDLTDAEEEAAVRQCFGKGSSKNGNNVGEGLPLVLMLLHRQRGFLRLRTGRMSLYADFSKPNQPSTFAALERYHDQLGHLATVAGSLLTLVIPLGGK